MWLALLLPLAQGAASWHALSHVRAGVIDADGNKALHATHCELCLTAAAVQGGALTSQAPQLARMELPMAAPQEQAVSVWLVPAARPYETRAPPSLLG